MALRWRLRPSCSSRWDAFACPKWHSTQSMKQQRAEVWPTRMLCRWLGLLACSAGGWAAITGCGHDPPLG